MFKLSARAEYGILLVHFLRKQQNKRFSIAEVSKTLGIPEQLARKITKELTDGGIICTFHGRFGGIQALEGNISVYDVIHALHEDISLVPCISGKECGSLQSCEMSGIFHRMNQSLESLMKLTRI